jgi:CheY-like chemotaxis protein
MLILIFQVRNYAKENFLGEPKSSPPVRTIGNPKGLGAIRDHCVLKNFRISVSMLRLYLVDDSAYIRLRLVKMLSQIAGVQIVGESSGAEEAIQAIGRLKPDVVLLDIQLASAQSGIDVLRTVKRDNPSSVVAMLTNYPYPQYQTECLNAGADYFFDKSTQFDRVVSLVEQLLQHFNRPGDGPSD